MPTSTFSFDEAIASSEADTIKALDQATGKIGAVIKGVRSSAIEGRTDPAFATHLLESLAETMKSEHGPVDGLKRLLSGGFTAPAALPSTSVAAPAASSTDSSEVERLEGELEVAENLTTSLISGLEEISTALGIRVPRERGRVDVASVVDKVSEAIESLRQQAIDATNAKTEAEGKLSASEGKVTAAETKATEATNKVADAERKATAAEGKLAEANTAKADAEGKLTEANATLKGVKSAIEKLPEGGRNHIRSEEKRDLLELFKKPSGSASTTS
jgi:hypothetical protein